VVALRKAASRAPAEEEGYSIATPPITLSPLAFAAASQRQQVILQSPNNRTLLRRPISPAPPVLNPKALNPKAPLGVAAPPGGASPKLFRCDFGCGFVATFEEVAAHEGSCSQRGGGTAHGSSGHKALP